MIGLIIALAVLLGTGGTAIVADSARPGDALFGVDQAVEQIQINIARKENKDTLRIKFAEERIQELQDITSDDEAVADDSVDVVDETGNDDVSDDKKELTDDQKERVKEGTAAALTLLTQLQASGTVDAARLATLTAQLNGFLGGFTDDANIQINDERLKIKFESEDAEDDSDEDKDDDKKSEQKIKIEERTDEGRIRVEIKDGSIEIKTKLNNDDDDDSNDKEEGLDEIEAKIYSDKTIVTIEINDEETIFTTSATTKEGIVAAVLEKFPELKQLDIEAIIKIETEDDDDDVDGDGDDDSDENESDDDEDEDNDDSGSGKDDDDNDDDNSGSGNGDDDND